MNGEGIEFSDRYSATGTPYPDLDTVCTGHCEGMGCVPVERNDGDPRFRALWEEAEKRSPTDDGWHFVVCPDCNGTRLRPGVPIPEGWPPPVKD
jgi:hypothetical protein